MAGLKKIVILASGRGSNFCALADAILSKEIPNAEIKGLICNKATAPVIAEAERRKVPHYLLASKKFINNGKFNREAYEDKLIPLIESLNPDWILLAGYMLILGAKVVRSFPGKIINIHPSLLPDFKGLHPVKQALEAKREVVGCTVHLVTEALDDGPTLEQSSIKVLPGDTEESLAARLLPVEHSTYIRAVRRLCSAPLKTGS